MNILKLLSQKNSDFGAYAPVKIAFLGDSVTHGCFEIFQGKGSIECIYDYEAVYHSRLQKLFSTVFHAAPVNIINAGVSGGTAKTGLERIGRDVLSASPDMVVVCFGLNDVQGGIDGMGEYERSLEGIFRRLKTSNVETIFMTPNMMNTYISPQVDETFTEIAKTTAELQNSGMMDAYMDCARKVCMKEEIPVCDCYKRWKHLYEQGVDVTSLLSNYINHPTREMHMLFASSLFDMIIWG